MIFDDDYPLDNIGWSVRVENTFKKFYWWRDGAWEAKREEIALKTVGQVRALEDWQLLRQINFGRAPFNEVRSMLGTTAAPAEIDDCEIKAYLEWKAAKAARQPDPWFECAF